MPPAARKRASRPAAVLLAGLVPVFASAVLAIYRPPAFARVDDSVYDALLRGAPTRPPSPRVAIVDVDEASLASVGQWPWPRPVMGRLIAALRGLGASVVALDIIFAESDRFGVETASASGTVRKLPDEILADTLREGRVILGYGLTFDERGRVRTPCVLHPVSLAVLDRGEEAETTPFFRATGAICSLPVLADAARASGFLNAAPDADGILRRVPLVAQLGDRVLPSLAIAAVSAVTGVNDLALHVSTVNAARLTLDDRAVPVDGKSNLLLRYRGEKRTFPYLSAADVLEGRIAADAVRDRIVFVGTTALGTREVVATPLDTLFAGVEVQATVADNLLQGDFISRSPAGNVFEAFTVFVLGSCLSALVAFGGIVAGALGGGMLLLGVWWATGELLARHGVFLSPLAPSLGLVSALATMTFVRARIERGRAESAGRQRSDAQRLMVQTLLSLTETRDAETGRHSRRTQQYARMLAEQLASHPDFRHYLTPERIDLFSSLAPLHDIGKVGIPDHILNKPGALTPEELVEMRKHPVLGRDVILRAEQQVGVRDDATLALAKDIVYTHHERWDGAGYPQGLRETEIPIAGRVMAIVDVYDAVVSRTLYQASMSHDDAVKFIVGRRGTHFDPAVVDAFERVAPGFAALAHDQSAPAELE